MTSLQDLKNKWKNENEHYKTKEVGDGVQSFVIEVLKSDVFNFKQGLGSQTNSKRENEFTLEHSKQGEDMHTRRADIVIFVNASIVIPTEVEKFENILAGESQIMAYQKDWDKKYGILTDGYTWRFYNNTKYQIFTLDDLLNKTDEFKSFWSDYTKESNYYLEFLNQSKEGIFKQEKAIKVQKNNNLFFEETTVLIEKFITKTKLYEKFTDKKTQTEFAYSYLIQFILVKVLVDSKFEIFVKDYNKKITLIINNLSKGSYTDILSIIRNLSSSIEKDLYRPFKEDQKFINQRLEELTRKDEKEIGDISIWLDIVCYIHRFDFSGITNDIFGHIYENYLKELYSDENLGQFFTPPEVVDFMLEEIGWTEDEIKKRLAKNNDSLSIIDPSCGSGTFLYSATDILMKAVPNEGQADAKKVEALVNNNIFGLDVEEFSLYLAEMSMLMRLLPCIINEKYNNPVEKKLKIFKTRDSVAEFWLQHKTNKAIDTEQTDSLFSDDYTDLGYKSLIRDDDDMVLAKQTLIGEKRERFDFVIGNPPYIGYNECAKKKLLCFEMIKGNVRDKNGNLAKIDLSDVYGINLHSVPNRVKSSRPSPNLYSFFMALGNGLLKNGGRMCYIIPQTLLSAGALDVMRYYLAQNMRIDKIVTFSCKMFVNRGISHIKKRDIATSSLIITVTKLKPEANHKLDFIHYQKFDAGVIEALNDVRKGKNIMKKSILQSELLENVDNWNYLKQDKKFLKFYKYYKQNTDDLSCYYDHGNKKNGQEFWFDIGYDIDDKQKLETEPESEFYYLPAIRNKYLTIKEFSGFWKNQRGKNIKNGDISLNQANQGYNLLDSKYKILWSYNNAKKFYFSDKKLLWARNKYCAIGSNDINESRYLYSILESSLHRKILKMLFHIPAEKNFAISNRNIKSCIRIPIITEQNEYIKTKIIEQTEKMLALENVKLKDLVSFQLKLAVLPQKFNKIEVKDKSLICDDLEFEISNNQSFVEKLVKDIKLPISFQSLKDIEAIDFELRDAMKNYIDHLVFALYVDINLANIEFENFDYIKNECQKHEFFEVIPFATCK